MYKDLAGSIPNTIEDGIYACDSGASPNNNAGFLRQYTRSGSTIQIFYNVYQPKQFMRQRSSAGDAWSNWVEVSTDIPTFYKNYADLNSLSSALGVTVGIGELNEIDANDITENCIGSFSAGATAATDLHYPTSYGILISLVTNGYYNNLQIFLNNSATEIWTRTKGSTSSFGNWNKIIG